MKGLLVSGSISGLVYLCLVAHFPLPTHIRAGVPLDLMKLTGYSPLACALYAAAICLLFLCYLGAWRAARRDDDGRLRGWILAFAALFGVELLWLYPINATDLFQYFLRSRIFLHHGANPLVVPPERFPHDPFLPLVGEWTDIPSPYGPVWELLAALAAWSTGGALVPNLLALKALALASFLGSAALLDRILGRAAPARRAEGLLLFAWNPLVLLEVVGNGHNDGAMLCLVLAAIWCWVRGHRAWVLPTLVAAALVKAVAALLIPLALMALWREERARRGAAPLRPRSLALSIFLSLALILASYAPFWPPWASVKGVVEEMGRPAGFSLPALAGLAARHLLLALCEGWPPLWAFDLAEALPRWLALAGVAALYLRELSAAARGRDFAGAAFNALFAYLMLAPSFRMWYPAWLVPLAALRPGEGRRWRMVAFSWSAQLSVAIYGYLWGWVSGPRWLITHALGVPFTFLPPLAAPKVRCTFRKLTGRGRCSILNRESNEEGGNRWS